MKGGRKSKNEGTKEVSAIRRRKEKVKEGS